jgi:hypothetical protein
MTRSGVAGKGSRSKGCRGAEHGQTCTKDRTDAVALRAALESTVQLGRGNEVNWQAELANPTKCRDSLQFCTPRSISEIANCPRHAPRVAHSRRLAKEWLHKSTHIIYLHVDEPFACHTMCWLA